ncbi:hypothetical protein MKEN_01163400 [Mycena kentingensis (nom. inval.)]|nr:hypothetical protein MKEN_01163400 [Mycena kentingensis (nom. inval.)]
MRGIDASDPRVGYDFGPSRSRTVPIFQTTTYGLQTVQRGNDLCALCESGYVYSRVTNPTVDVFEKRMAALEGGIAATATSSGMSAITLTLAALAAPGGEVVSASQLYGGTYQSLKASLSRLSIHTTFIRSLCPDDFAVAITEKTRAIYIETIANSDGGVPDIEAFAKLAHEHGIPLVVDNTFGMGGYIVNPIALGADIVVHSATEWIGGHGTFLAGVVIDSGNFDWRKSDKFPNINGPASAYNDINMAEVFYPAGFTVHLRADLLRDLGPALSPMNAFLALQGLETLSLRAQRHCDNALGVAQFLEAHPYVNSVTYLGLPSHPCHELAKRIFRPNTFGGVITFRVRGGVEKVVKIVEATKLASLLANVGDAKTLIIPPYGMVQGQISAEEKEAGGVYEDMIRVSVGIENVEDIIADLRGALEVAYSGEGDS